jgi:hypothetical protein
MLVVGDIDPGDTCHVTFLFFETAALLTLTLLMTSI